MSGTGFSSIAPEYGDKSIIQRSASGILFDLLAIGGTEDVLDVGCGTGRITHTIREITTGRVVGVDASEGMIREALAGVGSDRLEFHRKTAEELDFTESFDLAFCNSTFQWFPDPAVALRAIHRALRPGGRVGIQAPAKKEFCPNFITAINQVVSHPGTRSVFSTFRSPWLFLESSDEYAKLFERNGFVVTCARIDRIASLHSPEETFDIFSSGAIAGYLDPSNYGAPFDQGYVDEFKNIIRRSFHAQARSDGRIKLIFHRIYLTAEKRRSGQGLSASLPGRLPPME
jgi:ubiquinone/menaquinone biosynthesis C-methylase UbiE